ncbi:hypothetical protein RRF57_006057 [Xylaria bambusicola]|uniref:Uncharacterized protein n=1 Tax=Xylaria bambusicola TaxID=326684 RepID=A0AAN7UKL3_9PEZI
MPLVTRLSTNHGRQCSANLHEIQIPSILDAVPYQVIHVNPHQITVPAQLINSAYYVPFGVFIDPSLDSRV